MKTSILVDPHASGIPEWITIREATFLTGASEAEVRECVQRGAVRARRLARGDPLGNVLIHSGDLALGASISSSSFAFVPPPGRANPTVRFASHSSRRGHRFTVLAAAVASAAVLSTVLGAWLSWGIAGHHGPLLGHEARPALRPMPATPTKASRPGVGPTSSPEAGSPPGRLVVSGVEFVQSGQWVSAKGRVTNPSTKWRVSHSVVNFQAVDGDSGVAGTYLDSVSLAPGASVLVVAPAILVGSAMTRIESVRVTVQGGRAERGLPGGSSSLTVSNLRILLDGPSVTVSGVVSSRAVATPRSFVSCALFARDGTFAGAGLAYLDALSPGQSVRFSVPVPHYLPNLVNAVCGANER